MVGIISVSLTVEFVILLIPSIDGLHCYSCTNVHNESLCVLTNTCSAGQSCYKSVQFVNGTSVLSEGCIENHKCGSSVNTIVVRDLFVKRQVNVNCFECCSFHMCNMDLCHHPKPSACVNQANMDCATLSSIFDICKDIPHAKDVCPKFCGLCNVVDGGWSDWSDWSVCDVSCGNGTMTRIRTCTNPAPAHGGLNCTGNGRQFQTCSTSVRCTAIYTDCSEIKDHIYDAPDGVYTVTLWKTKRSINVFCDMTTNGGGWTVFQNRFDGHVDFFRNFTEYEKGFGDLDSEFWLGLDYIQEMVSSNFNNQLRIDLTAFNSTTAFEIFDDFSISSGPNYTLHVGNTLSSHNIDLSSVYRFAPFHNGMAFSTFDHDMDTRGGSCASLGHGAWWYKDCYNANLNGQYLTPGSHDSKGINYFSFTSFSSSSMKQTKISFRRSRR